MCIEYLKFNKKYSDKVYNFVTEVMKKELNVSDEYIASSTKDLECIDEYYNNGIFYIAIDKDKDAVVGTVAVKEIDIENSELKRYYVKEEYRGKKIGLNLLMLADRHASQNFSNLYLISGYNLLKAHKMYEMNGFTKVKKDEINVKIQCRDGAYIFEKRYKKM